MYGYAQETERINYTPHSEKASKIAHKDYSASLLSQNTNAKNSPPNMLLIKHAKAQCQKKTIEEELKKPGLTEPVIKSLQRCLWFVNGILDHDIDSDLLVEVLDNHVRIDTVPSGYFYPQFYCEKKKGGVVFKK